MDESLSEFQETKKCCAGPKTTAKKNNKPRKAPKKPRGQKDIRTALRSTKNELESYSKDFDKVCKKAGIDVDSEQLQLAIALSKSLQNTPSTSNTSPESSQTVTTQERIGKIRTTLQEYGFKVPKVKIAGCIRKIRKHRKNYKLIQTSEAQKNEIIADRYSQVLFQNFTNCSLNCLDIDTTNIPLYNLASNATFYEVLRLTNTYYVDNLIEKSATTGNLLRDWSKIPGRPKSPELFEPMSMSFSEIECSQDELDIILSGSLKRCKDIVKEKMKDWHDVNQCNMNIEEDCGNVNDTNKEEINNKNQEYKLTVNEDVEFIMESISAVNKYRSCSPDIFDDDDIFNSRNVSIQKDNSPEVHKTNSYIEVLELTDSICEKSQSKLCRNRNVTNRKSNDMELTQCIRIQSNNQHVIEDDTTQLSQKTNVTKRRSNDFMELTECVATSSQPILDNIDLTQSPDIIEENTVKDEAVKNNESAKTKPIQSNDENLAKIQDDDCDENRNTSKEIVPENGVESMDLTQSSNTSDELPFVSLTSYKNKSLDNTIIVDINDYGNINEEPNSRSKEEVHIDLTQNIQKDNETNLHSQSFFDEYNHDHSVSTEEPKENNSSIAKLNEEIHNGIDLTQSPDKSLKNNYSSQESKAGSDKHNSNSFSQPEFGKDSYSRVITEPVTVELNSNSPTKNLSRVNCTISPNKQYVDNPIDDIDLTQKLDLSEYLPLTPENDHQANSNVQDNNKDVSNKNETNLKTVRSSQSYSSLGKKDDVSIDYDDLIKDANDELVHSKSANRKSVIYENSDENVGNFSNHNSFQSNSSQQSEVFEISDNEFDYSLQKSKLELLEDNFNFGGISVMDDLSNIETLKKLIKTTDNTKSNVNEVGSPESFPVSLNSRKNANKCNEISPIKHKRITEIATPQKASSGNMVTVITPKNSEMIIKTNNVTPMRDYKSMTTPDIHRELDKYGIKPFKRKRAIQLLTHIYNQTHPIIESADELALPLKRHKPNDLPTLKKVISPRKLLTSPSKKDTDISKNNPDINKGKENYITQKNKERNGNSRKGKGIGKRSIGNKNKDIPEEADGSTENMQDRSKKIVEVPIIKEIECSPEDWVFQKREKAKVHSCRVPLHIALYNYICSRRDLREAILTYEPVEIDRVHKDLVGYGHRYDPKDLLKFFDKKCVTVKTADNEVRNQKR